MASTSRDVVIAISSLIAALVMAWVAAVIGVQVGLMWLLGALGVGLLALAILGVARPFPAREFRTLQIRVALHVGRDADCGVVTTANN